MPTIAESIRIHKSLLENGKGVPVPPSEILTPSMSPHASIGTGIPGPVRGSYQPSQVLGTDFVKANIIGGPMRSGTFPVPPNNTNNTAAARAALQAAAKASEAVGTINATIASLNNANVVTTAGPGGALQSGPISIGGGRGPISRFPIAPGRQRINQDQMSLDGAVHGLVLQTALTADSVDPSKSGVLSKGTRPFSVAPQMAFVPGANNVHLYYDGSNNSLPLHLFRDDGSTVDLHGDQNVTGLVSGETYYFYPAYDETTGAIVWSTDFTSDIFTGVTFSSNNSSPFSGYITTATSFSASTLSFSIELWFKGTDSSDTPLWQLNTAQTGSAGTAVARLTMSSGKIAGRIFTGAVTNSLTGAISVNDGQVHHVVFTYSAGVGHIYVDGVQDVTGSGLGTIDPVTVWNWIFADFASNPGVMSFWLSQVAFYNGTVLSSSQVSNHYNAAVNLPLSAYQSLVSTDNASYYWQLQELSGTVAADSIGTNTGTYTNTSYFTYDVLNNVINFVGSPAIAQTKASYLALQRQAISYRIPLSNGGIKVTTGGSSGGGGIQPGGGGGGGKFTQTL